MPNNTSKRDLRRAERGRKQTLNLILFSGLALIVAGFLIYQSTRPVEITPITPQSHPVPVDGTTIGNPGAPVLVEAFEDFQCPACQNFTEQIEPLILKNFVYTGIARFSYRFYPIIGNESVAAANAALCANANGRFWDFHDILYANQLGENRGAFSTRKLEAMGASLGLDATSFNACLDARTFDDAVQADFDEGRLRTVVGTPTIFVNGEILPDFDYLTIAQAIELAAGE